MRILLTFPGSKDAGVFDEEVGKGSMNMSAHFLASFR